MKENNTLRFTEVKANLIYIYIYNCCVSFGMYVSTFNSEKRYH